jgi:hypothetical protein
VRDHPHPYPLGWVNSYVELKVTKKYKLIFSINANLTNQVEVDVMSFNVSGLGLGSPYLYLKDVIFMYQLNIA